VLLAVIAASTPARAGGATVLPRPTWLLFSTVTPPPAAKPRGFVAALSRLLGTVRPPRERSDREREAAPTGLRGELSAVGASLAGLGLTTGGAVALAGSRGPKPPLSFGPTFCSGGGGVALSLRW